MEGERSRIKVVQIYNLGCFLAITKMDRVPNAQIKACGVTKGLREWRRVQLLIEAM